MSPQEQIGQLIARMRRHRQLSQRELADRMQVSQPYIAKLESGGGISVERLVEVATALDCIIDIRMTPA